VLSSGGDIPALHKTRILGLKEKSEATEYSESQSNRESALTLGYTRVILFLMKTAVSLPDSLFKAAEKTAEKLGIPRSQLFAKALEEFIYNHEESEITDKLNEIYSKVNTDEDAYHTASVSALRALTKDDTW